MSSTEVDGVAGDAPSSDHGDLARQAADAAERARVAQQEAAEQAERARRLAEEYARLTAQPAADESRAANAPEAVDAPAPAADAADDPAPGRLPYAVAAAVVVAALAFAVVALVIRLTGHGSGGAALGRTRDQVLLSAQQDIVVLNTLDYRHVAAGLRRWSDASTGTLHDQLTHVGAATRAHIVAARRITTAHVLAAAVVSLDPQAATATVIASVELRVAPAGGGTASVRRERLQAQLHRVGGTWKVASLQQVGVTLG